VEKYNLILTSSSGEVETKSVEVEENNGWIKYKNSVNLKITVN
jgi:hypothetical protein